MAVPKRKTSKARKAKRRTHFKLEVPGLNACPNCGSLRKNHNVCPSCFSRSIILTIKPTLYV